MEPRFQQSFIPKKPITMGTRPSHTQQPVRFAQPTGSRERLGLIYFLSTIFFLVAIIGTGGVFGYKQYLGGSINQMDAELTRLQESFDSTFITEMMSLDNRLKNARQLLSRHISAREFFELLQSLTLKEVQFTDFSLKTSADGSLVVDMIGKARNYVVLTAQSDLLSKDKNVKKVAFSDLDLDITSNVTFRVNIVFSSEGFLYKDTLQTLSFEGFPY